MMVYDCLIQADSSAFNKILEIDLLEQVKEQYEQFPYPPVHFLALPKRGQGRSLAYELGMGKAGRKRDVSHRNKRILVAGAGTLEALIVAQMHPYAKEVVAVDISAKSIEQLKRRVAWSRINDVCRFRWSKKLGALPPMRFEVADLTQWQINEPFDYIIASNMLHHVTSPVGLLKRLASWLVPGGLLRVMTYPKQSRFWLRYVGQWLQLNGVEQKTPNLKRAAKQAVQCLPVLHPIRQCYEAQSETKREHGIVDAFLHACEHPLSPLEWQAAVEKNGLVLIGEQQNYLSSSAWLSEIVPQTAELSVWQRLQILDDLLELTSNPIFWLQKKEGLAESASQFELKSLDDLSMTHSQEAELSNKAYDGNVCAGESYRLPSLCLWQLKQGLLRAANLLNQVDVSLESVIERIQCAVERENKALSIGAYPLGDILRADEPWGADGGQLLEDVSLSYQGEQVVGETFATQLEYLQLRYGTVSSTMDVELLNRSG